jgi:diguanylate cyclase (GGDEF)-like protein
VLRVFSCLTVEHDLRMVVLAAAICFISCLTAYHLAAQVRAMPGRRRTPWLGLLAFVTGTGIWATHFVAMLAYRPELPSTYLLAPTMGSIVIAIATTYAGWRLLLSPLRIAVPAAATVFAGGIVTMHFTGMAAMRIMGRLDYDPILTGASVLVGAALCLFSAWLFARRAADWAPAAALGGAICAIHFGSMAALGIHPDPRVALPESAFDVRVLTILVAIGILSVMVIALVTAIFESRVARAAMDGTSRLKRYTESALEGLAILEDDIVVDANDTFWAIAGHDPAHPPAGIAIRRMLPEHTAAGQPLGAAFIETRLTAADGDFVEVEAALRTTAIRGVAHDIVVIRDITERKASAAAIAHLISHDPLTGAGNRLSLGEALARALAEAADPASAGAPVAMLCLDLDRFKTVNDLHGHPIGDAVLVEAAHRIRMCLAPGDVLARLGGDEFAIVQADQDQPRSAGQLAQRIIDAIATPMIVADLTVNLGVSIGVALYPSNATDADDLHKKADLAMYLAKSDGRGIYRFFDAEMDRQLSRRRRLEADLRGAAERDELHLYYQPIACLQAGGVVGFEVLARWQHPVLGAVSPTEFVPLAEEIGLVAAIGELVLARACAEAARWLQPLKISVNLSPVQIMQDDIVGTVTRILAETGLDAERLDLEVTEGLLIRNPEKALATLRALKALGVSIVMDDFGTGYSSFGYFRAFPFDKVKIDQSFIRDLTESHEARAIVKAVIGLGKGLGMSMIAEGVETEEQLALLQAEGCDKVQGYLISRPGPIEQFERIVFDYRDAHAEPGRLSA